MLKELSEVTVRLVHLERVLQRSIGSTPAELESAVDRAIDAAMKGLALELLPLDSSQVDWSGVVRDAVYRRSSFDDKTEAGFRDRIVIEAARQASEFRKSKGSPLALVSRDRGLLDAAKRDLPAVAELHLLSNVDDLASLINAMAAGIPLDEQHSERREALELFFGRSHSHLKSSTDVLAFLVQERPESFERLPDVAKPPGQPAVRIQVPVFIGAALGSRIWRTPIAVTRERVFDAPRPMEVSFGPDAQAPGGVPTELNGDVVSGIGTYRYQLPSGVPGFRAIAVRDAFEVGWLSTYDESGKQVWRNLEGVTYVKRTYELVGPEDPWQTTDD